MAPEEAVDTIISSISSSTRKQYQSALENWIKFCEERKIDCFNPDIKRFLLFLWMAFDKGASYGTLNNIRCAVSFISVNKIGENPLVRRFLKGCFNIRPTRPKYSTTWDVNIVLEYLEKLPKIDELNLKDLSIKTVTLLSLVSAQRAQTLSKIVIDNIKKTTKGIEIIVTEKLKTSAPGKPCPVILLPEFKERPNL